MFFVLLLAMMLTGIAVVSRYVSPWVLPIVLISALLLFVVVAVFILRVQGNAALSESGFLQVILEALRLTPILAKPRQPEADPSNKD